MCTTYACLICKPPPLQKVYSDEDQGVVCWERRDINLIWIWKMKLHGSYGSYVLECWPVYGPNDSSSRKTKLHVQYRPCRSTFQKRTCSQYAFILWKMGTKGDLARLTFLSDVRTNLSSIQDLRKNFIPVAVRNPRQFKQARIQVHAVFLSQTVK